MALPPKLSGHALILSPNLLPIHHTLELYLDYTCPFSARLFITLYSLTTHIRTASYARRLIILFRHQIQPWHPTSTLMHEAALAVQRINPAAFWEYSAVLFENQKAFFDEAIVEEARNDVYESLAMLAPQVDVDTAPVYDLLKVPPGVARNAGNRVTADLKLVTKMSRLVGIHVTPTVVFNGLVVHDISSSSSSEQWKEWLAKHVV